MRKTVYLLAAGASLLLSAAFIFPTQKTADKPFDTALLDSSYRPGDDFFEFVNNKWIKANPIPAEKSKWGAFHELDEQSRKTLKGVFESASANKAAAKGSNTQLLGSFYRSAMDTLAIEKEGINPLKSWLAEVDNFGTPDGNARLLAKLTNVGLFGMYVDQDLKNSSKYTLYVGQSGLGLPDRDYYFRKDDKSEETRIKYREYIKKIFILSGDSPEVAEKNALTVYGIEEKMADNHMTLVEQRDPYAVYNPVKMADWISQNKNINWATYFRLSGINTTAAPEVVVGQPKFFSFLDGLLASAPAADWKTYFRFHIISDNAPYLSKAFVETSFDFYSRHLNGKEVQQPRWKTVIDNADYILRDILGQEYVKVKFSENAKKRANEMVTNLRNALAKRINQLSWMGPETKKKAQEKLSKIITKIGYPDKWRSYAGLEMTDRHWWYNLQAGFAYEQKRNYSKLGKAVDKTEWLMGPQEVNAYYNPTINEIVFPAAILQPPFFNEFADDAINYGGIGMVIGHELTHGFDDQGRQFDANGNLTDWWTKDDAANYEKLTKVFVDQYSAYIPIDDVHINGELTLGENIADLGGCIIAFEAFKTANKNTQKIDGFTPEQRFFLSLAQIWRGSARPQALREQLFTDPHSPGKYRVNGVVTNMNEFYEAFGLVPTDKLFRPENDRARMW